MSNTIQTIAIESQQPHKVNFSVGSPTPYHVPSLELKAFTREIEAIFEDGTHQFTSPEFKLGIVNALGGAKLMERLKFGYSFASKHRKITLCRTDYASSDGMALETTPENIHETCIEHAAGSGLIADEFHSNRAWKYRNPLMPGAVEIFKDIVRAANSVLIQALKDQPQLIVRIREVPPPLPVGDYLNLCAFYRDGQFLEIYNPKKSYEPSDITNRLGSTIKGIMRFPDTDFANVIGSKPDPLPLPYTT